MYAIKVGDETVVVDELVEVERWLDGEFASVLKMGEDDGEDIGDVLH